MGRGAGNDTECSWTLRPERPESNPARSPTSCDPGIGVNAQVHHSRLCDLVRVTQPW